MIHDSKSKLLDTKALEGLIFILRKILKKITKQNILGTDL